MKTSANGISLIKRYEGLEIVAYQDIAGVWTIGYGHTESVRPGQKITVEEAEELLIKDLNSRELKLDGWRINNGVYLNQNQFDALMSFIYNVGFDAFKGSTAATRLANGDQVGAAEALTWWNKARVNGKLQPVLGLTRRRAAEKELFLTPINHQTPHRETNACPDRECRPFFR